MQALRLAGSRTHQGAVRDMKDVPLFDVPTQPLRRAKSLSSDGTPVRWMRLRLKNRVPCDECIIILHENHGVGPYADPARWKRSQGSRVLYLCHRHAEAWKKDDKR